MRTLVLIAVALSALPATVVGATVVYSEPTAPLPMPVEIAEPTPLPPRVVTVAAPSAEGVARGTEDQRRRIGALEEEVAALKRRLLAERRTNARLVRASRLAQARREQALRRELVRDPDVLRAIDIGAAAYGVSAARMRRIAWCESTYVADARLGRYQGLFQFGAPLWKTTPFATFDRNDAYAASFAAAWAFARGLDRHWPVCGKL
ncbi:MAG: hypothetical protein HYX33_01025 [Actinobacteria bacterium]|nr:hypothetical protein [Actinomycetota bacterium]